MQAIQASYIFHKNEQRIKLQFDNCGPLNKLIKSIPGARWSKTYKSWHIPCNKIEYHNFKQNLPQGWLLTEVKEATVAPVNIKALAPSVVKNIPVKPLPAARSTANIQMKPSALHTDNWQALQQYLQCLQLKAYSASTIKTYRNEFLAFLQTLRSTRADSLSTQRVKDYLQYCHTHLKMSENTIHSRMNALKFYYEQVLKREKFFWEIPRPKKQFILPKVLGESELKRLFTALQNKKHKAILFTAYSAGLRVSEVVNLELIHIDRSRMQLFIKNAKGKKDRYVMLSPLLLDILTNYYKGCDPRPKKYVFEGPEPGTPYSASSMQKIFQVTRKNAGIHKNVTFHSLRHSFATHLLEKGVDIKYIRDLLGHFDIKTTARYLHVKREQLVNIESPLDSLMLKDEI